MGVSHDVIQQIRPFQGGIFDWAIAEPRNSVLPVEAVDTGDAVYSKKRQESRVSSKPGENKVGDVVQLVRTLP
jgi:hypothetical protein